MCNYEGFINHGLCLVRLERTWLDVGLLLYNWDDTPYSARCWRTGALLVCKNSPSTHAECDQGGVQLTTLLLLDFLLLGSLLLSLLGLLLGFLLALG